MTNHSTRSTSESSPYWGPRAKLAVAIVLLVVFGLAAYAFRAIFVPLIIGAIMAYVLHPVARSLGRVTRLKHKAATALLYLALLTLVVPVGIILIPVLAEQALSLEGELVAFLNSVDTNATVKLPALGTTYSLQQVIDEVTTALTTLITSTVVASVPLVLDAARILLFTFFTFVIGFYLTRDGERFVQRALTLVPDSYRGDAERLLGQLNVLWGAFFRGQLILSLTVTFILSTLATILGLPRPILIGLWGGLLEFLPSIGNVIWGTTAVLVALSSGSTNFDLPNATFALVVFIVYVAFAQLDINILIPNIIGGQVRLHPMVVLISVIIGLSVGGVLGVALAAPFIASARIILQYLYAKLFDHDPFPDEDTVDHERRNSVFRSGRKVIRLAVLKGKPAEVANSTGDDRP
jgi:predicted PurR-regulated permease PerM